MLGAGTSGDPWQVETFTDLEKVGVGYDAEDDQTYALGDYYLVVADIDASPTQEESYNNDNGWEPIGSSADPFTGDFDGGLHTISGLYIDRYVNTPEGTNKGLFGWTDAANLHNVVLADVDLYAWRTNGSLVGTAVDTDISRCAAVNSLVTTNRTGGGLIGTVSAATKSVTISECFFSGTVAADGQSRHAGILADATSTSPYTVTLINCYAEGHITGGDADGVVSGGLVGRTQYGECIITDSYAACEMTLGGNVAGILYGPHDHNVTVNDSFGDSTINEGGPVSGSQTTAHGRTTAEMQDIDTYTTGDVDWDMIPIAQHDGEQETAIWYIDDGNDYPRLWYELSEADYPMPHYIYGDGR